MTSKMTRNDLADELDAEPEPGALASRSPQQQPPRLATPGHNARPTEHENPEVTS